MGTMTVNGGNTPMPNVAEKRDDLTVTEMRTHMRRVETLCGVMRDLLLAASQVPPFSMMVTPEQIEELKNL